MDRDLKSLGTLINYFKIIILYFVLIMLINFILFIKDNFLLNNIIRLQLNR